MATKLKQNTKKRTKETCVSLGITVLQSAHSISTYSLHFFIFITLVHPKIHASPRSIPNVHCTQRNYVHVGLPCTFSFPTFPIKHGCDLHYCSVDSENFKKFGSTRIFFVLSIIYTCTKQLHSLPKVCHALTMQRVQKKVRFVLTIRNLDGDLGAVCGNQLRRMNEKSCRTLFFTHSYCNNDRGRIYIDGRVETN